MRKNPAGAGKPGLSWGEVGAEEEEVAPLHFAGCPAKKGKRIEVGQNAEEGEQARPGKMGDGRWEMGGEIDTAGDFSPSGEAAGGAAGEGEVGVGSQKEHRRGKFPKQKCLLDPLRTPQGDKGVRRSQQMAQNGSGTLVEAADRRAAEKGRAGLMNLFPKAPEGRVGIQGGSGEFDSHD